MMHAALILLAGGSGQRFQSSLPKQFLPLGEYRVVEHALLTLKQCPQIQQTIIVCDPRYRSLITQAPPNVIWAEPGTSRQLSVLSGLQHVTEPIVIIHDGARPKVSYSTLVQLLESMQHYHAAAIATHIPYTLKMHHETHISTLSSQQISATHTPQCLHTEILRKGLQLAEQEHLTLTDDVQAAEILGLSVQLIHTLEPQIKITYPNDLKIAQTFMELS